MQITEIHCRSILTRTTGYLRRVVSHSLNPYTGCGFGRSACGAACYVRHNHWLARGREWGGFVDVKLNAAEVYARTAAAEKKWARRRGQPFAVFFSSSTDPWQPLERQYRITRQTLAAMLAEPPDVLVLQTHTDRITDDKELIRELAQRCQLRAHISVEGDIDRLPGLPPPPCSVEDRLRALAELAAAGVATIACLSPLYPLRAPEAFFARLAATGARGAIIDHFIEGDGTPEGSRTWRTALPAAMANLDPESVHLSYRERMARIAARFLPVGVSVEGFAGKFPEGVRNGAVE